MRWWVRRTVYLMLLGAAALVVGILVTVTARTLDIRLLAGVCIIGGLAMVVVAIPIGRDNGGDRSDGDGPRRG